MQTIEEAAQDFIKVLLASEQGNEVLIDHVDCGEIAQILKELLVKAKTPTIYPPPEENLCDTCHKIYKDKECHFHKVCSTIEKCDEYEAKTWLID